MQKEKNKLNMLDYEMYLINILIASCIILTICVLTSVIYCNLFFENVREESQIYGLNGGGLSSIVTNYRFLIIASFYMIAAYINEALFSNFKKKNKSELDYNIMHRRFINAVWLIVVCDLIAIMVFALTSLNITGII